MDDGGHAVLNAVDQRIAYLLRLKRDHVCPASVTSEPGMTDLQMLEVLDRRTSLLDHVHAPLPAPPESGSPTP